MVVSKSNFGKTFENRLARPWIRILNKRIKKIHIKDFKKASASFVNLMEGNVDFLVVMQALKGIGYNDFITAEMGPLYINYPDMLLYITFHGNG